MKNVKIIDSAEPDGEGWWILSFRCGHKTVSKTRKDCKKYPKKEQFCGQCWANNQLNSGDK